MEYCVLVLLFRAFVVFSHKTIFKGVKPLKKPPNSFYWCNKNFLKFTQISKVKEVSDVCKVSPKERVDGVEGDGEEGHGEGQAELDVLGAGGGQPEELVGRPRGVRGGVARARTLIASKVPLRHLTLLRAVLLHGVTDAARQEVGEELKEEIAFKFDIPNSNLML